MYFFISLARSLLRVCLCVRDLYGATTYPSKQLDCAMVWNVEGVVIYHSCGMVCGSVGSSYHAVTLCPPVRSTCIMYMIYTCIYTCKVTIVPFLRRTHKRTRHTHNVTHTQTCPHVHPTGGHTRRLRLSGSRCRHSSTYSSR